MKLSKEIIMAAQKKWHRDYLMKNTIKYPAVSYRVPKILVPPLVAFQTSEKVTRSEIKSLIEENIDFVPSFSFDDNWTITSAHKWANQMKIKCASSSSRLSVYLRQIEKMFWILSENCLDKPLKISQEVIKLAGLLDFYRESVKSFFSSTSEAKHASSLLVRMRSVELLATWLVYCIAFNATRGMFPSVLQGYGVALHYQDLSHLVLQDEEHIVALKRVVRFLGSNDFGESKEVFSMRHAQDWDSATFQMGHRYSKAFLSSTLAKEKQDAKSRVNKHWLEVQRKQELARKLRNELQSLQRDLERAEEGLSDACRRYILAKELPIPSQCLDSKQCKFSFVLVDKNHVKKYVARFSFRNGSRCNFTWRIA